MRRDDCTRAPRQGPAGPASAAVPGPPCIVARGGWPWLCGHACTRVVRLRWLHRSLCVRQRADHGAKDHRRPKAGDEEAANLADAVPIVLVQRVNVRALQPVPGCRAVRCGGGGRCSRGSTSYHQLVGAASAPGAAASLLPPPARPGAPAGGGWTWQRSTSWQLVALPPRSSPTPRTAAQPPP